MGRYEELISNFFDEMETKMKKARTDKEKRKFNREFEYKFYDKVIMEIAAQELGGIAISSTFRNDKLNVSNPRVGDVVNGRDVSIIGIYCDMPYSVSVSRRKLVSGYDYKTQKFLTETKVSGTTLNVKYKDKSGVTEYEEETDAHLINTDIFPFFFGGMKQIRNTYTEQYVLSLIESTVNNVKCYLDDTMRKAG